MKRPPFGCLPCVLGVTAVAEWHLSSRGVRAMQINASQSEVRPNAGIHRLPGQHYHPQLTACLLAQNL